jgi:signal transduction histidine kinase
MWRRSDIVLLLMPALLLFSQRASGEQLPGSKAKSLNQLQQRLAEIDAELEQLAAYSFRSGRGAVGYQSGSYRKPEATEWIRIELGRECLIDQVVLVPFIGRDPIRGLEAEAFPVRFRILAGSGQTTNVVASFTEEDGLLPRIAPLVVSCEPVNATWVGVEATILSPRALGRRYALEFSEIFVFSGMENVAFERPVSVSSPKHTFKSRHERFLVDGFVPYMMDSAQGIKRGEAVILRSKTQNQTAVFTIDLQETYPISQIRLHAVDTYHTIPETAPNDYAITPRMRVIGATRPDFADASLLFDFRQTSIYDVGPIMIHPFPETNCRYIRLELLEFQHSDFFIDERFLAGFSEIEVLSKARNIAFGKPVSGKNLPGMTGDLELLTDGDNYFGKILPIRTWMNQLARRHDLETERPGVVAELNRLYTLQKRNLNAMSWLAAALAAGTVILVLLERNIRQRAVFRTRELIAANLHDELGANLHAAGLYSDLAKQEISKSEGDAKWSRLAKYVDEIHAITGRAAKTARFCTNMLEAKELYENPAEEMKRTAKRILTDLEDDISFTGEELLKALHPRRRIGLILFYKECLTNIIRHSGATRVESRLTADRKKVCLTVTDNGKGVETTPPSLKRRARLMKARLSVESCAEGGTITTLFLKPSKGFIKKAIQ